MKIIDLLKKQKTLLSFEAFPPKQNSPFESVYNVLSDLAKLEPDFISVTYGAGGSSTKNTLQVSSAINADHKLPALAHMTCFGSSKSDIDALLSAFVENGIQNVLALRGDRHSGTDIPSDFAHASDLISYIKSNWDFCVAAACYPEGHPETPDSDLAFSHLKLKAGAGCDFFITQLFFDNSFYYKFKEDMQKANIKTPVIVGIMPVTNVSSVRRICDLCGASIPQKFQRMMDKYSQNPAALKEAGIAYATEQIIDLMSSGVDGIHVYTMNKPDIAAKIMNNISFLRHA